MAQALEEACQSPMHGDVPVGAVLVDNKTGRVLAKCRNTREALGTVLGHAELNAITEGCAVLGGWRLSDCTLYVTLEPCPMCAGAILHARIPRVVYGAQDIRFGAFGSALDLVKIPLNHTPEVARGVLGDECRQMLSDYFKAKRKNKSNSEDSVIKG